MSQSKFPRNLDEAFGYGTSKKIESGEGKVNLRETSIEDMMLASSVLIAALVLVFVLFWTGV
jgi:hypothetical protein